MVETQEAVFDFDDSKSGRVNNYLGVYSAATGWDKCETGQTNPFSRWRAFFSFDTSALPDNAVIEYVGFTFRRRADAIGEPDIYRLKFSIGTFIGRALDGNAGEWTGGTHVPPTLTVKPADKDHVQLDVEALQYVNRTGDTDLKVWDDSDKNGGDPGWETNFNKDTASRCKLVVRYRDPACATATGIGTSSAAAVLEVHGAATVKGIGTATASGTVSGVVCGAATATGIGTSSAVGTVVVPQPLAVHSGTRVLAAVHSGTRALPTLDSALQTVAGLHDGTAAISDIHSGTVAIGTVHFSTRDGRRTST